MTVIDHLGELRKRLIYTALAFLVFIIVGFVYTKEIYHFLIKDLGQPLTAIGPSEILWVHFMIAAVFAFILTIPFAAYQIWAFVSPALKPQEKRKTIWFIPALFMLFLLGLAFGYFVILPIVLKFLMNLGEDMFNVMFTAEKYFSFVFNMTIPFAVLFELPLVIMFLTAIGILNPMYLAKVRRYAYFILIIIAVCITPPDFISDFLVAIPLLIVYEISISVSKITYKRRMKRMIQEQEDFTHNE
ncbi:twin-arginine translocase subunit TatC [Priestia taiwanensis]|nr:twin-arginine translocase subunit TatC [Priestia taiwanensis]